MSSLIFNSKKLLSALTALMLAAGPAYGVDEKVVQNRKVVSPPADQAPDWKEPSEGAETPAAKPLFKTSEYSKTVPKGQWLPKAEQYPDGALRQAYEEEIQAAKEAEEKELQLVLAREENERKKVESEREIAAKKRTIEGYKIRQEHIFAETQAMSDELTSLEGQEKMLQGELALVEQRQKEVVADSDKMKAQLGKQKDELTFALGQVKVAREKANRAINQAQIDMQKMRSEMAALDSDRARAENDRSRAEADELQVRTEVATMQGKLAEVRMDHKRANDDLKVARIKLASAQNDFAAVKKEMNDAERDRRQFEAQVLAEKARILKEIRNLEVASVDARTNTAQAEAEKARYEAEKFKYQAELGRAKQRRSESDSRLELENNVVMESRLALETVKAEIASENSAMETSRLKKDTMAVKLRNLASMAESSDMLDGSQRPFKITRDCKVRRTPAFDGEEAGFVTIGRKVVASPAENGWVKLMNTSGKASYVSAKCGEF